MNRLFSIVLAVFMAISLSACSGGNTNSDQTSAESPAVETPATVSGSDPVTTESESEMSS